MNVKELNALVEDAYAVGLSYQEKLAAAYEQAFKRASGKAVARFRSTVVTATAFVPPPLDTLTSGMTGAEQEAVNRVRDDAEVAVSNVLAAVGIGAVSLAFMEAIAKRGQLNFEQELQKVVRTTVAKGLAEGWSANQTSAVLAAKFRDASAATVQMLAETELTTLVNQRSLEAAQRNFQDTTDPVYKTWLTMMDNRVRPAHAQTEGQTVPINQPFNVAGYQMMYPGDPSAPLQLVARCRCRMLYSETLVASVGGPTVSDMEDGMETDATTLDADTAAALGYGVIYNFDGEVVGVTNIPMTASNGANVTITVGGSEQTDAAPEPMADGPAWKALLAVEGVPTEDGRMLAEGSLTWRELPLSLTAMDTSNHGEPGQAKVAGRIDVIWRDGSEVWGSGVFNTDEFGTHIYELVSNQSLRGNSIEPAVVSYEIWDRETMQPLSIEDALDAELDGRELLTVFTEAIIMASTVVATPAIGEANIMLASGLLRSAFFTPFRDAEVLTAAGAGMAPLHPPLHWFDDPVLEGPTGMTVTSEGRVYGHAALWDSCHIGEPSGPGICVPPPRSGMQYEIFHHGVVTTDEGVDVPCGQITMSTFHAGRDLSWKATLEHYEHSGCAVADVVAGEDEFGIWISGGLRPDLPAERVREMKGGALSGDWREVIGRGLEFLAALVVNIPGFPIPRPEARIVASASGEEEVLALVAAGIVEPDSLAEIELVPWSREEMRQISMLTRNDNRK